MFVLTKSVAYYLLLKVAIFTHLIAANAPNIDYSHNMRILKLPKNLNPGTLVYRLKGSHPTAKVLTFGIRDARIRRFLEVKSVSFRSADVYLRSPLVEKEYNFTIFVTDGVQATEVPSTLIVTESERAILSPFLDYQTIYTINEDAPHNSTIGYLVAKDRDSSNLPVTFEIAGSDYFAIRYVFGPKGTSKAVISLIKEVDYERRNFFPITVIAMNAWTNETIDTRNVATMDIIIAVKDTEDSPPKFVDLPSVVQISEELIAGNIIAKVTAEDGDYEINRKIAYSFKNSALSQHFMIEKSSGIISLKNSASLIKSVIGLQNPFILTVEASEIVAINEVVDESKSSSQAQIAFVIVALHNRPPTFSSLTLSGFLEENSPIMTAVRWNNYSLPKVSDPDSGLNGTVDLELNSEQFFTIQPNWGIRQVMFSILSKNPIIDYEIGQREVNLIITAKDRSPIRPMAAQINCKISIIDLNDNYPQFLQKEYSASFYEDATIGTKLVKVDAIDRDSGLYGKIKYTSINGPLAKNLLLDPYTGLITLKSLEGIDREMISEYTLTIEARDEDGFGNKNVTQLMIKILDANDNEPKFLQTRYDTILNPDLVTFTQPLIVKAVDIDQPETLNSEVVYEIIGGNYQGKFYIHNTTGEISIKSPLTFEKTTKFMPPYGDKSVEIMPNIILTVRAHDRGIPYRYSTVRVHIHSKDFLNRTVSFIVEEDESQIWAKKEEIQNTLTSLTGAQVHVHGVRPIPSNKKMSRIDTWISYPLHSTVDLRNLGKLINQFAAEDEQSKDTKPDIQTASVYRSNYDVIIWIILLLIFITLLFLIVLLVIWCLCYKNNIKSKKSLERIEVSPFNPPNGYLIKTNPLYQGGNGFIKKSLSDDEALIKIVKSSAEQRRSGIYDEKKNLNGGNHSASSDKVSKFRKIKMSKHQRSRIAPELVGNHNQIYFDDPGYVVMGPPRGGYMRPHEGTYIIDEYGHNYYVIPRSNGDEKYQIRRASSLREMRSKYGEDKFRSASEAAVRGNDYNIFASTRSKGHLSDQDRPKGGDLTMKGRKKRAAKNDEEDDDSGRGKQNSGSLPGSVESNDDDAGSPNRHSSDGSEVDMGLIDGVVFGVKKDKSNDDKLKPETSLKTLEHSEASDSDSGIGKSRMERQLNLKNSELMVKKSIFDLAFDDVKPNPIKSAESMPLTPSQD